MQELYAFFTANYFPHVGGVEQYTYNLTRELLKCQKHVLIVTSSVKSEPNYTIDEDGAEIYRIPSVHILGDRMSIVFPGTWGRQLLNIFERYSRVRIVIQTMLYPMSLWALNFASKNKYPYIVILHGANYVCLKNSVIDWLENQYENFMLRQTKRKRATVFAVSEAGRAWLDTLQIPSHGVLYNSVDYLAIESIYKNATLSIRNELEIPNNTVVFSFVGRLIPEKGVFQLIDAFSRLISEGYDIRLFIIGDGPSMEELKNKGERNIVYLGYKAHSEVLQILKETNCFCLPSDSEGFPTVILEAILCRNYIITAPYGGAKEIILSRKYGYVMDSNSTEDVYCALKYFLEHREICDQAVDMCLRHFFDSGFTWESTCRRLMSHFDKLK